MKTDTWKRVAPNIYRRGSSLYYRYAGKKVSLRTKDISIARALVRDLQSKDFLRKQGVTCDKKAGFKYISDVLRYYRKNGCPKRDESPRVGSQLIEEHRRLTSLESLIGRDLVNGFDISDCREYAQNRLSEYKDDRGQRTVDLDLTCLSSAFRWAARNPKVSGITANPIEHYRPRFRRSSSVVHCREFQPSNATELHSLARWMFERATSQVFGWQILFSAMIGQRCSELIPYKTDGTGPYNSGWIHEGHLYMSRSETHKGTASFIEIHPALSETIKAHQEWLKDRHPDSVWWFPSPKMEGCHVERNSLGHALLKACKDLGLPKRTVHGLRSYFVNVLRSQGMPDWQIALQIGHKSGGRLIVETYGEVLPIKIEWMPDEKRAWEG